MLLYTAENTNPQCGTLYIVQPPPELPCNPFYTNETGRQWNLVLLCTVAQFKWHLNESLVSITVQWYQKYGDTKKQEIKPEVIKLEVENYTLIQTSLSVPFTTFFPGSSNFSVWCEATLIGDENIPLKPSSMTIIRQPKHYQDLPQCVVRQPLGLPQAMCALNNTILNPIPTNVHLCECQVTPTTVAAHDLESSGCNGTNPEGSGLDDKMSRMLGLIAGLAGIVVGVVIGLVFIIVVIACLRRGVIKSKLKGKNYH